MRLTSSDTSAKIALSLVWLGVLINRIMTLRNFGFVYVDADQTVMWTTLLDYSNNEWHQPRFYGQDYSSALEALFAVPLYKLGLLPKYALPLVSSIMCLLPYFLFFQEVYKEKKYLQAFLISTLPLLLPFQYELITSMARGFLPGIFVAALAIYRSAPHAKASGSFRFGLLSVIAFSLNPNSVFITALTFGARAMEYFKNKTLLIQFGSGALAGLVLHYSIAYYYVTHPESVVHHLMGTSFHFDVFLQNLMHLDLLLNDVCPIFWKAGFSILLMLIALATVLFLQKKNDKAISMLVITFCVIATFGLAKTLDGTSSVIFPYSRSYLALPLVLCIGISWLDLEFNFNPVYVLLPCTFFYIHVTDYSVTVPNKYVNNDIIAFTKNFRLERMCATIQRLSADNHVNLVLVRDHYFRDLVNYGCSSCNADFPPTLRTEYERRTWLTTKFQDSIFENILILDAGRSLDKLHPSTFTLLDSTMYLLKENKLPLKQVQLKYDI